MSKIVIHDEQPVGKPAAHAYALPHDHWLAQVNLGLGHIHAAHMCTSNVMSCAHL